MRVQVPPSAHMIYKKDHFKGKKITIMGLGLLGRGVGDAKFLAEEGAEIIVTDLKSKEELAPSVDALKHFENITFVLGEHRLEDFRNRDFILKAAGVPFDSIYIEEAKKNIIPIEMSTSLFASLTPATIIGITGTRGKSTVTHLLYEILKKYYTAPPNLPLPGEETASPLLVRRGEGGEAAPKIFLGGNVKGVSTLQFLGEAKKGDLVVLELDSWQLQGFGDKKISPHVSIFTTLFPDHMNYYKNDMNAYVLDKANIFLKQQKGDFLIVGSQAAHTIKEKFESKISSKIIIVDEKDFPESWGFIPPGAHNKYNAALAIAGAQTLGVDLENIKEAVEAFRGISGRLEFVKEISGIKIYNDTTATTPDATIVALKALSMETQTSNHIILILGGADKNLDMKALFSEIPKHVRALVVLPGTGTDRVKKEIEALKAEGVEVYDSTVMKDAVEKAFFLCKPGDSLILSPAFTSFGMFKNEFDRGDRFLEIVNFL